METPREDFLDAMDLRCHIARRDARNLADGRGIQPFEIEEGHLPIDRVQPVNHGHHPIQCAPVIEHRPGIDRVWESVELVESNKRWHAASSADHLRRCDVVRDAVHPGTERATSVERGEASPQRHMNFLEEVEPAVRVRLIRPCESLERGAVGRRGLGVQVVLWRIVIGRSGHLVKVAQTGQLSYRLRVTLGRPVIRVKISALP